MVEEEQEAQKRPDRIGLATMIFAPMLALLFDLFSSFIPIVGSIFWIVFAIWFFILGISPLNLKRLATMLSSVVIELIPLVSILPSITVGVIAIIVMVKLEDKIGLKLPLKT
ncbi:MAG: hypothetical protein AAB364_02930 [Patescibacteria group bacterium]